MPKILIEGVAGLDGEYNLDLTFTHRDFHTIKNVAEVRANEVMDALQRGDTDIIVALTAIALRRAGRPFDIDQLWDAEMGAITLDASDQEAEDGPPPQSASESDESSSRESTPSGTSTNGSTERSPETPPPSNSGTSVAPSSSVPVTSQT